MLYVVKGKAYLATYDEDLKVYPEVTVAADGDGYSITTKGGGVAKRPAGREVLTVEEYLARYGSAVAETVEDEGPKLPTKAKK